MIGNSMQTVLITGINGYLGSNLAKSLSENYIIVGLEYSLNKLNRIEGCNFKVYSVENGVPNDMFIENKIDIIIHTATFYGRQNESIKTIANSNLFIPFDLLNKAIENSCSTFINTDTVLDRFVSTYALTKNQFREWLYLRRNELNVINMQLEHFYGPGASETNFITAMIKRLKNNEQQINLTEGTQKRGFIYIEDVVAAYKIVLENLPLAEAYCEFQICTQDLISIKELMLILKEISHSKSVLNFGAIPYRENELTHSKTDNSALINLGWKLKYGIQDGLQKTI